MANAITVCRILLIPAFGYLALTGRGPQASLVLGVAALTDWLDGLVARRTKVTEIGKLLDPLADRLLILTALIVILVGFSSVVPVWLVVLLVARDLAMLAGYQILKSRGKIMSVSLVGKAGTALLMLSLFLLLAGSGHDFAALSRSGLVFFYIGSFTYLAAAGLYARDLLSGTSVRER